MHYIEFMRIGMSAKFVAAEYKAYVVRVLVC